MNPVTLSAVNDAQGYLKVSELAHEIWREYYSPILSGEQIEYMLDKFQSPAALKSSGTEGYKYYLVKRLLYPIGYIGLKINEPMGKMFLSKIYLLKADRKKGYAKNIFFQLDEICKKHSIGAIWLTVNKHNPSVEVYKKLGFKIMDEVVADIGNGFVMDDYIMEKDIK